MSKESIVKLTDSILPIRKYEAYAEDHKIGSLFLVMSYNGKYKKVEKAIKNFFEGIYEVQMQKDTLGKILEGICEKVRDSDFGIVVLGGIKRCKHGGKSCIRLNIPFEYGMLQILDKPVMVISEKNARLDINNEFSDIKNENHGEKIDSSRKLDVIERRIGQIFNKFIPVLARHKAKEAVKEIGGKNKFYSHEISQLIKNFVDIFSAQIKNEFKFKLK
jgi:hypothetical protein